VAARLRYATPPAQLGIRRRFELTSCPDHTSQAVQVSWGVRVASRHTRRARNEPTLRVAKGASQASLWFEGIMNADTAAARSSSEQNTQTGSCGWICRYSIG
jgi:hypothetical protein